MKNQQLDKYIFLGLKKGFSDLVAISKSRVNKLMIATDQGGPDSKLLAKARKLGFTIGFSSVVYYEDCAADLKVSKQIKGRIKHLVSFDPDEIWIDHLRFHGRWEIGMKKLVYPHEPCQFCKKIDRTRVITSYFKLIKELIPKKIKLGFFARPFKKEEFLEYEKVLGLDYQAIKNHVEMISPMLYHRTISRPVSYISEYVKYLDNLGYQYIIPIIQVKDMPDDLADRLGISEIKKAYREALKPPSKGVALFCWAHAAEKGKTKAILEMLKNS